MADSARQRGACLVVDTTSNAKAEGLLFWPFRGDYWIIELGSEYEYAVIGTPNRNTSGYQAEPAAWTTHLYAAILQRAKQQGLTRAWCTELTPAC